MSDVLYEANPSMVRMYPFGVLLSVLLIPLAVGILALMWMYLKTKMDKLIIKTDEVVWEHGLLSKDYTEIGMNSVRTAKITQSLLQRMLNAGDLYIYTAGDEPEVVIKGLPEPGRIREYIKGRSAD
ncbi:MAG: PH domain-containing protein [Chromatiales bacterium]|jgi:uncharacterized membrane protein YdbT with pleckstrin-like domain